LIQLVKTRNREDVKRIFDPLITEIERLVDDQVNLVTVKRMSEGHPKAKETKVTATKINLVESNVE
jgi:hypothetical protein